MNPTTMAPAEAGGHLMAHGAPRQILRPYIPEEAASLGEIAKRFGRSKATIRRHTAVEGLGRKIAGQWHCSKVCWAMFMNGDPSALAAYWTGDRNSDLVRSYFRACGVPLPLSGEA